MGLDLGTAWVRVRGDMSMLGPDLQQARGIFGAFISAVQRRLMTLGVTLGSVGSLASAIFAAGRYEQTVIAFETMLGSAREARDLMADLTEFAALTPFEMPEILQAARGLVQFGERGEELMETLHILGNAAAGTGTQFGLLALIFNQVRGVGKLLTQDFRQLSTRGVISLQDIADHFGVTTAEAQKMLSEGKIAFEDLRDILKKMSEEGGRFHNLMEKQSQSFLGLLSTLKDALGIMARTIGEVVLPAGKSFLKNLLQIAEAFRTWMKDHSDLIRRIFTLGAALGAAKLAIMGVNAALAIWELRLKAVNIQQAILQALTTPTGWLKVAAAIGAGVLTVYALERAFHRAAQAGETATDGVKSHADAVQRATEQYESYEQRHRRVKDIVARANREAKRREVSWWREILFGTPEEDLARMRRVFRPSPLTEKLLRGVKKDQKELYAAFEKMKRLEPLRGLIRDFRVASGLSERFAARLRALENQLKQLGKEPSEAGKKLLSFYKQQLNLLQQMDVPGQLKEYQRQLAALHRSGKLSLPEVRKLWGRAFEKSELYQPIKQLKELRERLFALRHGLTETQIRVREFARQRWVTPQQIRAFQRMTEEIGRLERKEKMRERGKALAREVMTPVERAAQQLRELEGLFGEGALGPEAMRRQLVQLRAMLVPERQPIVEAGRVGFRELGSRMQEAVLRREDPQREMLRQAKLRNAILKRIEILLAQLPKEQKAIMMGPEF